MFVNTKNSSRNEIIYYRANGLSWKYHKSLIRGQLQSIEFCAEYLIGHYGVSVLSNF